MRNIDSSIPHLVYMCDNTAVVRMTRSFLSIVIHSTAR